MGNPTCATCRWWRNDGSETDGLCCRMSPVYPRWALEEDDEDGDYAMWPRTLSGEWCGEHQPVPTSDASKPVDGEGK